MTIKKTTNNSIEKMGYKLVAEKIEHGDKCYLYLEYKKKGAKMITNCPITEQEYYKLLAMHGGREHYEY